MTSTTLQPHTLTTFQRRMAILSLMTVVMLASLDTTISNTALPNIVRDLQTSEASVIWIANAYQIAMIAMLLPFAALGDAIGYRKVYLSGLCLFCFASLLCGVASSLDGVVFGRLLQGIGAAAIMSVNMAFIRYIYPSHRLGKGLSLNALIVALGFALGPLFASIILSWMSWHWLFLLNVPIGCVALGLAIRYLPVVPGHHAGFDYLSGGLCAAFLGLLGLGFCLINPMWVTVALLSSLICLITLFRRQAHHPAPILATDLLKRPIIGLSSATSICAFATQALALISLPFLFQNHLNISLIDTGFLLTTWPAVVAIMAIVVSSLSDRFSAGVLCSIGLTILSLGMFGLTMLSPTSTHLTIISVLVICGVGFGLYQAPNMKAIMSNAPVHRSGGASGIVAISRLMGQTCGAALVAQCFHIWQQQGPEMALWLGCFCAALGCVFSLFRLKN